MVNGTLIAIGLAGAVACAAGCGDSSDGSGGSTATSVTSTSSKTASSSTGGSTMLTHAELRTFVNNVVMNQIVAKDPVVLSYFVPNTKTGTKPSLDDIEECLATQVGAALNNGDVYPPAAALPSGYACRGDMAAIHQGTGGGVNKNLGISDAVFMSFISDITNEATAEMIPADVVAKLGPVLLGLQTAVVDPASKTKGLVCYGGAMPGTDGKCAATP